MVGVIPKPLGNAESSINCDCHFENNSIVCHAVKMYSSLILLLINFTEILLSYISYMHDSMSSDGGQKLKSLPSKS